MIPVIRVLSDSNHLSSYHRKATCLVKKVGIYILNDQKRDERENPETVDINSKLYSCSVTPLVQHQQYVW